MSRHGQQAAYVSPNHWWSRKSSAERRPLLSLGRLVWNTPEWRHPFKMLSASLLVVMIGAGVIAAVVTLTSASNSAGSESQATPTTISGVSRVTAMLNGIPQQGTALGSPNAPVTLVEFGDPQCPYCGAWERDVLPEVVDRYVRTGKVRVVFNGLAFVGPDSETALRTALSAASQNRFWNVLELLYENQGSENTGWVTDPLLRTIGAAVPGLDTARMLGDRYSTAVDRLIEQARTVARNAGVNATPSFAVGPTGGQLKLVHVASYSASAITPVLDAALKQ